MLPPEFQTDFFSLKPYALENEDKYIEIVLDEFSIQYMGGSSGIEDDERKLFKKIFQIYNRNDERWFWIWGIYKNELLCGHLELKETEHTTDTELEIVYMIHPNERRKGIMSKVLSFIKEKQQDWKKRIIATVNPKNLDSITLLEKWGIEKTEILINSETGEEFLKLILKK
ncbi:GNAT family N-acetyltransferase [Aquimarina algicola]|uniref:GNAT family N-acetyltransferase n=1 Tax=Aquimarina algicola TaxID=2589995 RepID=A0A504J378_9FLAO|nr:GNAT family N-acetyltransferase [Aquimarina algicola]TPN82872.1 GNAT family N-acetyltransferase [Aquimarina algicola]